MVFTNAYVLINAVDLSNHVKSVKLNYSAAMLDNTVMSNTTKSNQAGLKEWSVEVEFLDDYVAASVDATLFSLIGAAAFAIEIRPDAGARSASNPGFTGNAVLASYDPISAQVGELASTSATLNSAGALSRQIV